MTEMPSFHPAAQYFPLLSGDALQAFTDDLIRSGGARTPVVFQMLPDGTKLYLDGRNRVTVCLQEGLPFREEEFWGEPSEVEDWILSENLQGRRHLNSSQMAVVAIRARASSLARGIVEPIDGDWGEVLARRYATNRNYLFICQSLLEEMPHLLDEIRDGRMSVFEARAELKKRRAKNAPKDDAPLDGIGEPESGPLPPLDDNEPREPKEPSEKGHVVDGRGEAVPEQYREVFAARGLFSDLLGKIAEMKLTLAAVLESVGGEWADSMEANAHTTNLENHIRAAMPHAVCPQCEGRKKTTDHKLRNVRCQTCDGNGFVNQARFDGDFTMEREEESRGTER